MKQEKSQNIIKISEIDANRFNLIFLCALIVLSLVGMVLNIVGVFPYSKAIFIPSIASFVVISLIPIIIYIIHDKIKKLDHSVLVHPVYKYVLLIVTYIGILILCVMMSFHAVLLMAIPPLIVSQYYYNRRDSYIVLILSVILVPIAVYGGFLFGIPDRNMIKGMITDEEAMILANRLEILTVKRTGEIFLHYVVPRVLTLLSVVFLGNAIARRNTKMLDTEASLSKEVEHEMERINTLQSNVIEELASVIESRDTDTGEHVQRTKTYAKMIAKKLKEVDKFKDKIDDEKIDRIVKAAPLHDIGKIVVSDTILLKPGRLTPEEFEKMKIHTTKGGEMVTNFFVKFDDIDFYHEAYNIAKYHHEKWDGSGYPEGLKEEDIPLEARIMAIADVFDALVSKRVYKDAVSSEEAFSVIVRDAGRHFDPDIVKALIEIKDDFINYSLTKIEK